MGCGLECYASISLMKINGMDDLRVSCQIRLFLLHMSVSLCFE